MVVIDIDALEESPPDDPGVPVERCPIAALVGHDADNKLPDFVASVLHVVRTELMMEIKALRNDIDILAASFLKDGTHIGSQVLMQSCSERTIVPASFGSWNAHANGLRASAEIQLDRGDTNDVTIDTWRFRQSCWDAAAFVGDSALMMSMETIIVSFVTLLSACMQVCFIIIVLLSMSRTRFDDDTIDGYHLWRTITGHSVQWMDRLTLQSLVRRVCDNDSSLYLSDPQRVTVEDINTYLFYNAPFNGPMMCSLALFTWLLSVSTEFLVLKDMYCALLRLPRGRTFIGIYGHKLQLESLSLARLFFIVTLGVARSGIAFMLLLGGSMYLAVTTNLEDILLNAVALEFVLNVDELLHEALVPAKTRRFLMLLQPLPLPKAPSWGGVDLSVIVSTIGIFGFLAFACSFLMVPEFDRMIRAMDELCGGVLDFSYTIGDHGTVVWAKEQVNGLSPDATKAYLKVSSRYRVLRGAIENDGGSNIYSINALVGPGWSVDDMSRWDLTTWGYNINAHCGDATVIMKGQPFLAWALSSLRDSTRNYTVTTCAEVAQYCNTYPSPGINVRMWCPRTCGCPYPNHPSLTLFPPELGCPSTCKEMPSWHAFLKSAECKDQPLSSPLWSPYTEGWIKATETWMESYQMLYASAAKNLSLFGCTAIGYANVHGLDLCNPTNIKSLTLVCPETCKCNITKAGLCPETC